MLNFKKHSSVNLKDGEWFYEKHPISFKEEKAPNV